MFHPESRQGRRAGAVPGREPAVALPAGRAEQGRAGAEGHRFAG